MNSNHAYKQIGKSLFGIDVERIKEHRVIQKKTKPAK